MFAAFSLTSNATYTVVVSPYEGVLNEVYHRELTYEEIKKAQKRLMEECEKLKNTRHALSRDTDNFQASHETIIWRTRNREQRWQPKPADRSGRECLDQSITDNAGATTYLS